MFSSTVPSSLHSYQVAAVWSSPSGRIVATTHGFGCFSSSCSSDGGNPFGIRRGAYGTALEVAHVADEEHGERADEDEHADAEERGAVAGRVRDHRNDDVAERHQDPRAQRVVRVHARQLLRRDLLL